MAQSLKNVGKTADVKAEENIARLMHEAGESLGNYEGIVSFERRNVQSILEGHFREAVKAGLTPSMFKANQPANVAFYSALESARKGMFDAKACAEKKYAPLGKPTIYNYTSRIKAFIEACMGETKGKPASLDLFGQANVIRTGATRKDKDQPKPASAPIAEEKVWVTDNETGIASQKPAEQVDTDKETILPKKQETIAPEPVTGLQADVLTLPSFNGAPALEKMLVAWIDSNSHNKALEKLILMAQDLLHQVNVATGALK